MDETINLFGLLSINDFAKKLGKPASTIRTWKAKGKIPKECFLTIGTTIFVKVHVFKECMGLSTLKKEG